jgi:CheY-like chemotaxis protein
MLALFLARLGHEVVLERSLADGLARLAEWWDVVVSDIALGDGSGLEIAHRARSAPQRPGVLVALTGFGVRDGAAASRRAGFDHHLVKPVDLDALRALIERPDAGSASGASAEPA